MHSNLGVIILSRSRAPWKGSLATKQLKRAKGTVSCHRWITSMLMTRTQHATTPCIFSSKTGVGHQSSLQHMFSTHRKVLKKKTKNKFKGFSMKILNVTNCHLNGVEAGSRNTVAMPSFVYFGSFATGDPCSLHTIKVWVFPSSSDIWHSCQNICMTLACVQNTSVWTTWFPPHEATLGDRGLLWSVTIHVKTKISPSFHRVWHW